MMFLTRKRQDEIYKSMTNIWNAIATGDENYEHIALDELSWISELAGRKVRIDFLDFITRRKLHNDVEKKKAYLANEEIKKEESKKIKTGFAAEATTENNDISKE